MRFFTNCKTAEELKKAYKKLVRQYHPDLNPGIDDAIIKAVNAEYDSMWARLKDVHTAADGTTYTRETKTAETPQEFRAIIEALMKCNSLTIDLVGSWIWVTGNTYENRDTLKAHGFKWANRKKAWYWHRDEERSKSRREMTLDEIKDLHGCETWKSTGRKQIATA